MENEKVVRAVRADPSNRKTTPSSSIEDLVDEIGRPDDTLLHFYAEICGDQSEAFGYTFSGPLTTDQRRALVQRVIELLQQNLDDMSRPKPRPSSDLPPAPTE